MSKHLERFDMRSDNYWRNIVAAASTIETSVITAFSPKGFAEAMGRRNAWYFVQCGSLVLKHDGQWGFSSRDETCAQRLEYAFKSPLAALTALENTVKPSVPACAGIVRAVHKSRKGAEK